MILVRVCHALCFIILHEVIKFIFRQRDFQEPGFLLRGNSFWGLSCPGCVASSHPHFWTNFSSCSRWWPSPVIGVKLNSPLVITLERSSPCSVYCVPRYNPTQPPAGPGCRQPLPRVRTQNKVWLKSDLISSMRCRRGQWGMSAILSPSSSDHLGVRVAYQCVVYWFFVSWQRLTQSRLLPVNDDEESSVTGGSRHITGCGRDQNRRRVAIYYYCPHPISLPGPLAKAKKVYEPGSPRLPAAQMISWPRAEFRAPHKVSWWSRRPG